MAASPEWIRYAYLIANGLCWLISIFQMCTCIVFLLTQTSYIPVVFGDVAFLYVVLAFGISVFICGFIGCLTGVRLNSCLVKTYLVLVSLSLIAEIGFAVYVGIQTGNTVTESTWQSLSQAERNDIQRQLGCCAYNDPSVEYSTLNGTVVLPLSCYLPADINGTIYFFPSTEPCRTYLDDPASSMMLVVLIIAVIICLIFVMGITTAALILTKLKESKEEEELTETLAVPKPKKTRRYRFVRGPMNLGKEYSDLE